MSDTDSDPDIALPTDAPVWATLIQNGQKQASRDRREQTAAIGKLADSMNAHNAGAAERHTALLIALQQRDAGTAQAIQQVTEEKSALRKSVEAGVKEVWSTFKQPLAGLVIAICAYWGWRYFQVPSTTTPVSVVTQQAPPPTDVQSSLQPSAP